MGIGQNVLRAAKGIALVAPLGLTLSPVMVMADSNTTSSFDAQYQQNTTVETQLLQQAKALNLSNWQALTLSFKVQVLNQQISQLYAEEQQLVNAISQASTTTPSGGNSEDAAELNALNNKRTQLLAQLKSLWQQAIGTNAQLNLNYLTVKSHSQVAFDRGEGHGNGKGHDKSKHGKGEGQGNHNALVNQIRDLINQIKQVDSQIAKLQQGSHNEQGNDEQGDSEGGQPSIAELSAQLQKVQQRILQLQQLAIQDLQKWIALGGAGNGGGTGSGGTGSVPGVAVWSNGGSVIEGGSVQYVAQLLNASNQPVKQSGVKIDFSLVGSNNDGGLSSGWATTDANGQATVNAVAGNTTGLLQVAAQVDGTTLPVGNSPVVRVVDASLFATHLVSAGAAPPTTLSLGQTTGAALTVLPENAQNAAVVGDTLQVSTSNPAVLALASPDTQGGNVQTLATGQYTLPPLTAKATGSATVTITDTTEVSHPSLTFTVNVQVAQPTALVAVNPNGSKNTSTAVSAGVDGPFQIAVVDTAGNIVTTPTDIVLTAAQVNQILGTGNGVRTTLSGNDVATLVIPAGQSAVTVYADNVAAGNTNPVALPLTNIVPTVTSATVNDNHTVTVTFNEPLATTAPSVSDFSVAWGSGSATPQSVSVTGNTVTLSLWGTPLAHGSAVSVAYNPGADQNALSSSYGVKVAAFNDTNVSNPL